MIIIDSREITEHPEIPEALSSVGVAVDRLEAGDYCFLGRGNVPTGIERSEIGNLVQKLRSGELEEQMVKCRDSYQSIILLIEGVYDQVGGLLAVYRAGNRGYFRVRVYPNTRYKYVKALEIRLSELGIELIHSPDFKSSMDIIETIYHQRTKPEEEHNLFKHTRRINIPTRLTNNPYVPKLMSIANRLSEKVAIRLINKYGSIWAVLNAPDEDLLEIEGVGRTIIQRIKEGIGKDVE